MASSGKRNFSQDSAKALDHKLESAGQNTFNMGFHEK